MARDDRRPGAARPLPLPTSSEAAFDALLAAFGNDDPAGAAPNSDGETPPFPQAPRAKPPARGPEAELGPQGPHDAGPPGGLTNSETQTFLARLYASSGAYLERDRFASIGESFEFFTKAVGVTFEGRQDVIGGLRPGVAVDLRRQPENPHDPNAIAIFFGELQLGFLRREIARRLAEKFDAGERYHAEIASVTGGGQRSFGVNLHIVRDRPQRERVRPTAAGARSRADILSALIGERELRDPQRAVLERVDAGKNTLAVFGTGRGKSLCFQYPAAYGALERGRKTVVLYPLRALANDQYEALTQRLEPLGVRILRANGAIDAGERRALMDALETGTWDILCSTPEFFGYHLERFSHAASGPALIVVDEAHHLFESKHRPAYGRIGEAITALGSPQVLALTATASDDVFAHIRSLLNIETWVIDPTVRTNLEMIDARGSTNKIAYIAQHAAQPGKSIVYCNSRSEATKIAGKLRTSLGDSVAFYHAGVPAAERTQIERMFRESAIRIVVATSAFGEGIDLPDVRNVFLYHLNFDFTEFNQQSGRAGRDGGAARIHLVCGEKDRRLNEFIIERAAPTLHTLRLLYREMKRMSSGSVLRQTYTDIAATLDVDKVDARTVSAAIGIFTDAGLVDTGEDDDGRFVRFLEVTEKADLTRTSRYAEGEAERESFARFCELVLGARIDVLENVVNRPIYPVNVPLIR